MKPSKAKKSDWTMPKDIEIQESRTPGDRFAITDAIPDGGGRNIKETSVLSCLSSAGIFDTEPRGEKGVSFVSFDDLYKLTLHKQELLALSDEIKALAESLA